MSTINLLPLTVFKLLVALDTNLGSVDAARIASARSKVHRLSTTECLNTPQYLPRALNKPYMITSNPDASDGLVNGAIGVLNLSTSKQRKRILAV